MKIPSLRSVSFAKKNPGLAPEQRAAEAASRERPGGAAAPWFSSPGARAPAPAWLQMPPWELSLSTHRACAEVRSTVAGHFPQTHCGTGQQGLWCVDLCARATSQMHGAGPACTPLPNLSDAPASQGTPRTGTTGEEGRGGEPHPGRSGCFPSVLCTVGSRAGHAVGAGDP